MNLIVFSGLAGALHLAQWLTDLQAEKDSAIEWMKRELPQRLGGMNKGYLYLSPFFGTVVHEANISTVRAIRERLEYGDEISIGVVNSMVNFMGETNKDSVDAALRCAPLNRGPMTTEGEIEYTIRGLERYPSLFDELSGEHWRENSMFLVEATLDIIDQCGMDDIVEITKGSKGRWESFTLASEATAALILERRDQIGSIIDVIRERRTVDAELITSVLDAHAQALSNGAL